MSVDMEPETRVADLLHALNINDGLQELELIELVGLLKDKVERLTAELATAQSEGVRMVRKARAERDRLLEYGNLRQMREIDRLRAALEEIDKATLAKDAELALWVIRSKARQALAGGEK